MTRNRTRLEVQVRGFLRDRNRLVPIPPPANGPRRTTTYPPGERGRRMYAADTAQYVIDVCGIEDLIARLLLIGCYAGEGDQRAPAVEGRGAPPEVVAEAGRLVEEVKGFADALYVLNRMARLNGASGVENANKRLWLAPPYGRVAGLDD